MDAKAFLIWPRGALPTHPAPAHRPETEGCISHYPSIGHCFSVYFTSFWFRVVAILESLSPHGDSRPGQPTLHRVRCPAISLWWRVRAEMQEDLDLDRVRHRQQSWASWMGEESGCVPSGA